jgi:hypothetical protein
MKAFVIWVTLEEAFRLVAEVLVERAARRPGDLDDVGNRGALVTLLGGAGRHRSQ